MKWGKKMYPSLLNSPSTEKSILHSTACISVIRWDWEPFLRIEQSCFVQSVGKSGLCDLFFLIRDRLERAWLGHFRATLTVHRATVIILRVETRVKRTTVQDVYASKISGGYSCHWKCINFISLWTITDQHCVMLTMKSDSIQCERLLIVTPPRHHLTVLQSILASFSSLFMLLFSGHSTKLF